jgi:hypothetical protein
MHTLRHHALASAFVLVSGIAASAQMAAPPRVHNRAVSTMTEGGRQVVRLDAKDGDGVAWWSDVAFSTGIIELDIRGRNVPQASFVGVAFHGTNETTYEAVYFRPFNFRTEDPARRLRAVQYVSHPAHPWQVLRQQHPGVYEKPVVPPPDPDAWIHVTIHVEADTVKVFVDAAASAALEVKRLTDRQGGWIGLWVGNGSPGDFANVRITPRAAAAISTTPASSGANLSGTYAGHLQPEGGGDPIPGRIVVVDRGTSLDITLGASVDEMFAASNVRRSGNTLTFDADAPGDTPNHLTFDVTLTGDTLSGAVVQQRDGQTRKARLTFARQ